MVGHPSRYAYVSRRAMLRSSLGAGIVLLTGACGTGDSDVFTGAVADGPTSTDAPTTSSTSTTAQPNDAETSSTETTAADQTTDTDAPAETAQPAPAAALAVAGELIVSFTYTRGAGGKIEWPYVAVWVEDGNGELVETIALFYEQGRRGARWLDHLDRWFAVDADRVAAGGTDDAATISSATRAPGTYDVAWDGTTAGVAAGAGEYFICIESAREDGPYSLIREPVTLAGALPETPLPDDGELSAATVRIDA